MIKATEALEKTNANIKADQEAKMTAIQKFLDEECDTAIRNAIDQRQYYISVEVPSSIASYIPIIINLLLENGYQAKTKYGAKHYVLIMWN